MKTHVAVFVVLLFLTLVQETKVEFTSHRKMLPIKADNDSSIDLVSHEPLNNSRSSNNDINWLRHAHQNLVLFGKSTTSKEVKATETPNSFLNLLYKKTSNINFKIHRLEERTPKTEEFIETPKVIAILPASVSDITDNDISQWESVHMKVFYNESGVVKVTKVDDFNYVNDSHTNDPSVNSMDLTLKSQFLNIDPAVFSSIDPSVTSTKKGDYSESLKSEKYAEKTQNKMHVSNNINSTKSITVTKSAQQINSSTSSLSTNKDYLNNSTYTKNQPNETNVDIFKATVYAIGALIILLILMIAYKLRNLLKERLLRANCFNRQYDLEEVQVQVHEGAEGVDLATLKQRAQDEDEEP